MITRYLFYSLTLHIVHFSAHDYKNDDFFFLQFNKQEVNYETCVLDTIFPVFAILIN